MPTNAEIDRVCREAMSDGFPLCPWFGTAAYDEHLSRKREAVTDAMRAAWIETRAMLAREFGGAT